MIDRLFVSFIAAIVTMGGVVLIVSAISYFVDGSPLMLVALVAGATVFVAVFIIDANWRKR